MTFGLLSTFGVLLGVAALGFVLWLIQRLRVQHREVEVLSTLFWQAAIEGTRARVFVRQFRHLRAWLLLLVIASLLWMLTAQPSSVAFDGTQHVVLLDMSVNDASTRAVDLQLAVDRAATLPTNSREVVAVGDEMKTLLAAGETIEHAELRATGEGRPKASELPEASGLHWAIDALSVRASEETPLVVHVTGDAPIGQEHLDNLPAHVSVYRISRDATQPAPQLQTLGIADSSNGRWDTVDVAIGFANHESVDPDTILITINNQPVDQSLEQNGDIFVLPNIAANGETLNVNINKKLVGALTLPVRDPIRVTLDEEVPDSLRQLIALDSACQIVESDAEITVGSSATANLRLSTEDQPAFLIESDHEDPQAALTELIDELALKQIDAMSIAEQTGQIVDVQVVPADKRSISIWQSLFTNAFDFQESRTCPILVSRAIRWLAKRPPVVEWVARGERLPAAASEFDRVAGTTTTTIDGREMVATPLFQPIENVAAIASTPSVGMLRRFNVYSWLGILAAVLLTTEWALYQRGRMP